MNKTLSLVTILVATALVAACSPVKFSNSGEGGNKAPCNVSAPCPITPTSFSTYQDQTFASTNKVDILIVVDNSSSMVPEQANLAAPFNGFINNLLNASNSVGLDWQVAVTNTDICPQAGGFCNTPQGITGARGRFYAPVTANVQPVYGNYILNKFTPSVANVFASTVRRVTTNNVEEVGSGDERGTYAASLAIDLRNSDNAGFFRDSSNLAIVVLSDENVRSVGATNPNDPAYGVLEANDLPQNLLNKVVTTFGGQKSMVFNSIVIKSGDSSCQQQQAAQQYLGNPSPAHFGTIYEQMSNLAQNGSIVGSICDNGAGQFASMLSQITGSIQNLPLLNRMTLNYIPIQTPTVTFNPTGNAVAWTWAPGTNVINFNIRPANGTTVHVEYTYSTAAQKSFGGGGPFMMNPKNFQIGFPRIP